MSRTIPYSQPARHAPANGPAAQSRATVAPRARPTPQRQQHLLLRRRRSECERDNDLSQAAVCFRTEPLATVLCHRLTVILNPAGSERIRDGRNLIPPPPLSPGCGIGGGSIGFVWL